MRHPSEHDWSGTSDGVAALTTRAAMSLKDRVAWLGEALELAHATDALAATRTRRQAEVDAWWAKGAVTSG